MATVTGSQRLLTLSLNSITVGGGSVTSSTVSNWNTAYSWGNHASAGYLTSVPNLDASKITTGTFSTARIPNLSASKITSGTLNAARIPDLSGTYAVANHNHNGVYEPAFSKNNAFNKNFGTTAGTVAQGNDSRINNGNTAYGWGNHASAGYLTSVPNLPASKITSGTLALARIPTSAVKSRGSAPSDLNDAGMGVWRINTGHTNQPSTNFNYGTLVSFDNSSDTGFQLAVAYNSTKDIRFRGSNSSVYGGSGSFQNWERIFHDGYHPNADKLTTPRTIAGSSFDGTANISISYNNLTNKPSIPAAANNATITIAAGASLTGGGNFTTNQGSNETITINHQDTSSQASVNNSGNTVIQDVTLDTNGHVTGLTSKTLSIPAAANNGTMTISAGNSLSGGGSFTANQSGNTSVTLNVATPANIDNNWRDVVAWNGQLVKDTAVEIHGSGYLRATYLNMTHGVGTRSSDTVFYSSNDDYIRKTNATGMRAALDIYTKGEVNALIPTVPSVGNGTITINAGGSLSGGGSFTTNQSGNTTVTLTGPTIPTSLPANGGNADTVDGVHAHGAVRNNQANKLVRTDGNGYIQAGWINTTSGSAGTTTMDRIYASYDGYVRYYTPANFGAQISSHINYNNIQNKPTIPDTSNLVTTNTAQTISGAKTFSSNVGVSGNVSANFYAFNGAYVNATADVRAPIFYDRNNTGFYLHADGESVLGNVRANDFRLSSGDGKGVRFWNSNSYKIYMSATSNSSWGGRAPYESTSDYNMYFRMNGGTNRGFVFRNNTTNVAGIDASGNFNTSGIVKTGNGAASAPAYSFTSDYDSGMFSIGSNAVGFSTGGTQRFKMNSNGLMLTGTSSLWVNGQQTITNTRDIANVVNYQNTDGHMQLHRTGAAPLIINRKGTTGSSGTSRGEILNFKSASTKIGRIGYAQPYGGTLYFATGNTSGYGVGVNHFSSYSSLLPVTHTGANNDNSMDLGSTSARYDDVYATNGTIQTSDRNEKQDIQELTDAETRAAVTCKGLMRRFRWVDSVTEKGDDARYHFGAIAQDVEAAFIAEGLDAGDYGLFIRSTWWEHEGHSFPSADVAPEGAVEKTRLGIRYNQLFAFIIGAL